jgi:hypothetical protein
MAAVATEERRQGGANASTGRRAPPSYGIAAELAVPYEIPVAAQAFSGV